MSGVGGGQACSFIAFVSTTSERSVELLSCVKIFAESQLISPSSVLSLLPTFVTRVRSELLSAFDTLDTGQVF
jgi:hypothetical protein